MKFIEQEGAKKGAVVAEKLAKGGNNPKVDGLAEGVDLVVEDVQIQRGSFKVREYSNFVVRVKNRGKVAIAKGTPVPLVVKIEGQGRRMDYESYTFVDGIPAGETVSVTRNNNGPWVGNLGWTADAPGKYEMEVQLDKNAVLGESDLSNNKYRLSIDVAKGPSLNVYAVEKIFRGGANAWTGEEMVANLKKISEVASPAFGAALKGAAAVWNNKKDPALSTSSKEYIQQLVEKVRPVDADYLDRLASVWKIETKKVEANVVRIHLKTLREAMKYDLKEFSVPAGAKVELIFENVDAMQHNWVLGAMGSMEKIGAAADKMITAADGLAKNYVPEMPEVLAYTTLVESDGVVKVVFKAPTSKGNYPYLCTFPGHWRIMNGVMKVE
jgi:azurin